MTMKKILIAILLVAGCSKSGMDRITSLKDEACACKDKACGDAVNKKLDDAVEQLGKDLGGKNPDDATAKKLIDTMAQASECLSKLQ
jgi:hypothetical protein